jgi:hypothetical protein
MPFMSTLSRECLPIPSRSASWPKRAFSSCSSSSIRKSVDNGKTWRQRRPRGEVASRWPHPARHGEAGFIQWVGLLRAGARSWRRAVDDARTRSVPLLQTLVALGDSPRTALPPLVYITRRGIHMRIRLPILGERSVHIGERLPYIKRPSGRSPEPPAHITLRLSYIEMASIHAIPAPLYIRRRPGYMDLRPPGTCGGPVYMNRQPNHIRNRPAEAWRRRPYMDETQKYWWGSLPYSGELLRSMEEEGLYRWGRLRARREAPGPIGRRRFYRVRTPPGNARGRVARRLSPPPDWRGQFQPSGR